MTGSEFASNYPHRAGVAAATPPPAAAAQPSASVSRAATPPPAAAPPSSVLYVTRDVLMQEAVPVWVSRRDAAAELAAAHPAVLVVSEDDVEPTDGWRARHAKAPLCVCFTHAFGKCSGKNNCDPGTCFQIHIRLATLAAARAEHPAYKDKAQRLFFSRTVKAHLPPELRAAISLRLGRPLALHYLEFAAAEVQPTRALSDYERHYRAWLTADVASFPHGRVTPFTSPSTLLCTHFCCTGACPSGAACGMVHANLALAQVKEPALAQALADLARGTAGPPPTSSSQQQHQHQRPRTVSLPPPWATPFAHAEVPPPPPAYGAFGARQPPRQLTPPPLSTTWGSVPTVGEGCGDAEQRLRNELARLLESPLVNTATTAAFY